MKDLPGIFLEIMALVAKINENSFGEISSLQFSMNMTFGTQL